MAFKKRLFKNEGEATASDPRIDAEFLNELQDVLNDADDMLYEMLGNVLTPIKYDVTSTKIDTKVLNLYRLSQIGMMHGRLYPASGGLKGQTEHILFTLPKEMTPSVEIYTCEYQNNIHSFVRVRIKTNGVVDLYIYSESTMVYEIGINLSWIIRQEIDFNAQQ